MKLAFSTLGCTELDIKAVADTAKEYGIHGVELRGKDREHVSPIFTADERKEVKKIFADRGVAIVSVTAYTKFAFLDAETRKKHEDELIEYARLSADLGAPFVRTFIGAWDASVDENALFDAMAESITRVARAVKDLPVKVCPENHDMSSRGDVLGKLLTRLSEPNVGLIWDTAHSYRAGESFAETWKHFGSRIAYAQLKDEYKDSEGKVVHCLPGDGVIPVAEAAAFLKSVGFDGYLCLEWERKWHPEMPSIQEALPVYRKVLGM